VVGADVGRGDGHVDAGVDRRPRHGHAEVGVRRTVVEAGEDVAVKVDHRATAATRPA
jgi:hypothetical protein